MSALQGVYASESVSEVHPDTICYPTNERVLDAFPSLASNASIADQRVIIEGEFQTLDAPHVIQVRTVGDAIALHCPKE